jgi:hypothetical protein
VAQKRRCGLDSKVNVRRKNREFVIGRGIFCVTAAGVSAPNSGGIPAWARQATTRIHAGHFSRLTTESNR